MANVVVTMKIMPEGVEVDLNSIQKKAEIMIKEWAGDGVVKFEEEPVAFGLKAIKAMFVMSESKGATDSLEEKIKEISGVQSAEVIDVRRAIG